MSVTEDTVMDAGRSARATLVVTDADTAVTVGSGDVAVLGTPRLVALCEQASCEALGGCISAERTTVATRVQFDHLAPVPVGATVVAEATLVRVEGRRLVFTVSASRTGDGDGDGDVSLIGVGRLTRVLVDRDTFLTKAGVPAKHGPHQSPSSTGARAR
jgi:fluoroacetyl-CoA thioesterase